MRVSHHGTTDLADRLLEEPARDVPDCMDDHIRVVQTDSDGIQSKRKKCLYLYSGPSREDSLEHFLHQHGWDCENIDIEATVSTDLLDSDAWDSLFHRICCGEFDAAFASPPCGTFSAARTGEGGPRQLRGPVLPDLNGLPNLTEAEKHDVKAGNVLADRAAEAMKWFADNLRPWGVEQPARRDGKPSLFNLQKFQQLASRDDARFTRFSQCHFGSKFGKSTEILGNLDMGSWPSDCNHPSQTWVVPWSGQRYKGPHPPLKGKQIAIPESEWVPSMLKHFEPSGPYLTKATAHYPGLLNKQIASAVASTVLRGVKRKISDVSQPSGRNFADLPTPRLKVGNCFPTNDADSCVGGLRCPYKSFVKTPKHVNLGVQIRNVIENFCSETPGFKELYLESIGKGDASHFPGHEHIDRLRTRVTDVLLRNCPASDDMSFDVNTSPDHTCLKANFMKLWLRAADDPAEDLTLWLNEGAPCGLIHHPDLELIFPRVDDELDSFSFEHLATDFGNFRNYQGVEENADAAAALDSYVKKGFLTVCDTLDDCKKLLGGENPVLSKLGCIVKTKVNDRGQPVTKTRIILDAKQSQVTRATRRLYKSELPRISDAVYDLLALMSTARPGEIVTQFVADVVDAFWLIPINKDEQRFFVARFRNKFLVFNRTAQGSRTAPLTFAAIMSTAGRLLQSLLLRNHLGQQIWQDGRLEVYVDDPWACFKGTQGEINDLVACLLIGWELLGFPIAYHKATMGGLLKWIGMDIHIQPDSIEVHIPVDKLQEIKTIALGFLRGNILPNKDLRSFVGKCMNIAGVLHVWKPFIKQFYAAMYAPKPHGTPQNCTWTSQIKTGLLWVLAFVDQEQELQLTKRVWHVSEFLHQGERVMISWDASPWGFGAVLYKQMQPIEYIVSTPTEFEKELLELDVGSSSSQQVLECLAGLVALREWGPVWRNTNVKLAIRNDNIGALVLLGQLETKSQRNSIIAREAALDIGISSFRPQIVEHIPGITNVTCDELSRLSQPGKTHNAIPKILQGIPKKTISARDKTWWKSINPPCLKT